jgi:hypothetical protein
MGTGLLNAPLRCHGERAVAAIFIHHHALL